MTMTDRQRPVTIIGAGIAGLTAALSFAKAGFAVEVFERADRLAAAGAGLQLSPNALRVLAHLGLTQRLQARGVVANVVTLRAGRTGRRLAEVPVASSDGTPYLSIHRADLQAVLLERLAEEPGIELRLGMELVRCISAGGSAPFKLGFAASGARAAVERDAGILIGADGVRSSLSRCLGMADARDSGAVAWRMMLDRPSPDDTSGIEAWLGAGRHAVAYPIEGRLRTNLVLIVPARKMADGGCDRAGTSAILRYFRDWDRGLLEMIEAAGPATAWPLLTANRPLDRSCPPGLLLLGDAAHAMLPYAAQGAALAIEDAWVAAHSFDRSATIEEACARFAIARTGRWRQVRRRVGFHRLIYHLPQPFAVGRDTVVALRGPSALREDMAWLYDWGPPVLGDGS